MAGKIILIGGVAGTGKTTLSKLLMEKLNITHHLNLGWVLASARAYNDKEKNPELFDYSFRISNSNKTAFENFHSQTLKVKPAIEECLKRAKQDGTSMIVEGVNIIPKMIDKKLYDYCFFLKAADNIDEHKKMLFSNTHSERKINEEDIKRIRQIESELLKMCKEKNECIIPFDNNEKRISKIVETINSK